MVGTFWSELFTAAWDRDWKVDRGYAGISTVL